MVSVIDSARRDDAAHGRPHHPVAFAQESAHLRHTGLVFDRPHRATKSRTVHCARRQGRDPQTFRTDNAGLHGAQLFGATRASLTPVAMALIGMLTLIPPMTCFSRFG